MKTKISHTIAAGAVLAVWLAGCAAPFANLPLASRTPPPAVTSVAATSPATLSPAVTRPAQATTAAPGAPTAQNTVNLFFILGGDQGQHGKQVGCNDSVVPAPIPVPAGQEPMRYAYEQLLAHHEQTVAGGSFYNALYQSNLKLENISVDPNGLAAIQLSGDLKSGGVCDDPRIIAQLEEIARQFPQVKQVAVTVNGRLLAGLLSGKGAEPAATPVNFTQAKIFLIALEDAGKSGEKVGCGDSAVGVNVPISPTTVPAQALSEALTALLTAGDKYAGGAGLYNALKPGAVTVDSVVIEGYTATVRLVGQFRLGGECDNPRVQAQLEQTVKQFPEIQQFQIYLNGKTLQEALSLK